MAEALLQRLAGDDYAVYSAGTKPAAMVHPLAVEALLEVGIDIVERCPQHVGELLALRFHRVITLCDVTREECPSFPGAERIHRPFEDPALAPGSHEERLVAFRRLRMELKTRLELWLNIDYRRSDLTPSLGLWL